MTIDFSAYPNADAATKERTEEFFELAEDDTSAHFLHRLRQLTDIAIIAKVVPRQRLRHGTASRDRGGLFSD